MMMPLHNVNFLKSWTTGPFKGRNESHNKELPRTDEKKKEVNIFFTNRRRGSEMKHASNNFYIQTYYLVFYTFITYCFISQFPLLLACLLSCLSRVMQRKRRT